MDYIEINMCCRTLRGHIKDTDSTHNHIPPKVNGSLGKSCNNYVISIEANCIIVCVFDTPTQLQQTNYYTPVRAVSGIHTLVIAPIRAHRL